MGLPLRLHKGRRWRRICAQEAQAGTVWGAYASTRQLAHYRRALTAKDEAKKNKKKGRRGDKAKAAPAPQLQSRARSKLETRAAFESGLAAQPGRAVRFQRPRPAALGAVEAEFDSGSSEGSGSERLG